MIIAQTVDLLRDFASYVLQSKKSIYLQKDYEIEKFTGQSVVF